MSCKTLSLSLRTYRRWSAFLVDRSRHTHKSKMVVARAFTLLSFVAAVQGGIRVGEESPGFADDSRPIARDLILDGFCDTIDLLPVPDQFECTCSTQLFLPEISAACTPAGREPLCPLLSEDLICGVPELRFGASLLSIFRLFSGQLPFFAGVCYTDISIAGFELPGFVNEFCFDFANLQQPFTGPLSGLNNFFRSQQVSLEAASQPYAVCTAELNGEKCEVCEPCDDGKGGTAVRFSCLDGAIVSDKCSTIATGPLPTQSSRSLEGFTFVAPAVVVGS